MELVRETEIERTSSELTANSSETSIEEEENFWKMKISCNEIVKENKSSCTIATFVDTKTTVTRRKYNKMVKQQSYKTNATLNETTIAKLITNWKINNRNNNNKYNKNKKKIQQLQQANIMRIITTS